MFIQANGQTANAECCCRHDSTIRCLRCIVWYQFQQIILQLVLLLARLWWWATGLAHVKHSLRNPKVRGLPGSTCTDNVCTSIQIVAIWQETAPWNRCSQFTYTAQKVLMKAFQLTVTDCSIQLQMSQFICIKTSSAHFFFALSMTTDAHIPGNR